MTKRSKPKHSGRILLDHKQVGKKFIPPMLTIGVFKEVRWMEIILPELLWIALLNDKYGLLKGAELSLNVAQAAIEVIADVNRKKRPLYAGTSSFTLLNNEEQMRMVDILRKSSKLSPLKEALQPLAFFYPEFPLSFLFLDNGIANHIANPDINVIKRLLETHFNRWDKPATLVQANAVYIAFVTGKLKVVKGLALANFPAIEKFPETEESKRIAGAVRATVSSFFSTKEANRQVSWPSYFWNRGIELEECVTDD